MPECTVCASEKPNVFSCAHCAYVACSNCAATWFDSQLTTPSCMSCRRVLNVDNLLGSFSSSAAMHIFEDKRRAALVRADASYDLPTMSVVIPLLRQSYEAMGEVMKLANDVLQTEELLFDRRLAMYERSVQRQLLAGHGTMTAERNAVTEAAAQLRQKQVTLYDPAVVAAHAAHARVFDTPLTAAQPADRRLEAPPPSRFIKCCADGCAGLFSVADGTCLVCTQPHCRDCFELAGDATHACQPGAKATATYVLVNTKGCPRCHANIQRAFGCAQMMCTSCNCIFNWSTGKEEAGVVHNPHFFQLGAEARAAVAADRAARGLQAPASGAEGPGVNCVEAEFDPMCVEFNDPRIQAALEKSLAGVFPLKNRLGMPTHGWSNLLSEYRHVFHVEHVELAAMEAKLTRSYGEFAAREMRLARLLGAPVQVLRRVGAQHPTTPVAKSHVVAQHAAPLSDAKFAAQLMRIDTERSKHLEKMEILRTFVEAQKDLFRGALLVPQSERRGAVCRIFAFRVNKDRLLREVSAPKKRKAAGAAADRM